MRKSQEITRTQSFSATIRIGSDGQKKIAIRSQRWYQYQISKFKEGEEVTLEVHNKRPKRTDQQNRYYWGVYLPEVSRETGEKNLDKLHVLFSGKFLTEGVVEVLGEKVRMKKSTTELSVAEFSEFIMAIENDTNVKAPPTENYGLDPLTSQEEDYPQDK